LQEREGIAASAGKETKLMATVVRRTQRNRNAMVARQGVEATGGSHNTPAADDRAISARHDGERMRVSQVPGRV
jgi:hypothetical protein